MAKKDPRKYISRKLLCVGERFKIYRDRVALPGKRVVYREWAKRPAVCAVIALTDPHHMVLVRQRRYGVYQWLWEIPAGTMDGKETPLQCARRECEEETGFRPSRLKSLGTFVTEPANSDAVVYLYSAAELTKTEAQPEYDEYIRIGVFPVREVQVMLKKGAIRDAKSIIALYRYFYGIS